jgi:8-oxo-dGTP diphosphatase
MDEPKLFGGMEDWRDAPVFGVRIEAQRYTVRPSAYGVVEDGHGQIAVVRTPQGHTLPGGGIEEGETTAQAAAREALEECGLVVRVGSWSIRALQFIYSESERTHFEKWSIFVDATVKAVAGPGTEIDHELVWMTPEAASEVLLAESHRWAVESWRGALR